MPGNKSGPLNLSLRWHSLPYGDVVAAALLALCLQLQPTVSILGRDIRLSAADMLIPVLLPLGFLILPRRKEYYTAMKPWALGALITTLVMSYGFALGLVRLGMLDSWALVKYVGWFVLLLYQLLGLILPGAKPYAVIRAFLLVSVALHLSLIFSYIVLASFGVPWFGEASPRLSGLTTNPNAYGLSLLCTLSLLLAAGERIMPRLPPYVWEWVAGGLIAGILFTRSLAALGAMTVILVIWFVSRKRLWVFIRLLLIGAALYSLPIIGVKAYISLGGNAASDNVSRNIADKLSNPDNYALSLLTRTESNARAIEMWRAAPVFGVGLGVFYAKERELAEPTRPALQIHNSALWLLVEFGVFGFSLFAILIAGMVIFLYRSFGRFRDREPLVGDLALAGLMILPAWATMSLAHEMMYQRVPWLILGLCAGATFLAAVRLRDT